VTWRTRTRRLLPYLIVAAAGFLAAYLYVFFFVFPSDLLPSDAKVPNVVGLAYDDAANRLGTVGLTAKSGETRFHATAPKGTVLEQLPRPGTTAQRSSVVRLDVSAGQRTATVPRLVGSTQQQAQVLLENAGFDVGDVTQERGEAPRGRVLASVPAEGETLTLPRTVALTVSAGPPAVTLPDLLGRTLGDARSAVEQIGLTVSNVAVDSAAIEAAGIVTGQSPAAGASVATGTAVRLTVSGRAP
jgi:serine/threonine-protein kinase